MTRAFLLTALLLSSCGTTSNLAHDIVWPVVAKCGPTTSDIVGVVSRILLDDGPPTQLSLSSHARDELAQLAEQYGADTVACLLDYWREEWTSPGASASPERAGAIVRADRFLEEIGTKIEHVPQ